MGMPPFAPPGGTRWVLHTNVNIFTAIVSDIAANATLCHLPPYYDSSGNYFSNFDGQDVWQTGANYSLPGAVAYYLDTWHFAQWHDYVDGGSSGIMAAQPGALGADQCIKLLSVDVLGGDPHAYYWPPTLAYKTQTYNHRGDSGTIGFILLKWVGDVWVAISTATDNGDNLNFLNPGSPLVPPGGGGGAPGLTPNVAHQGYQIVWVRTNARVDPSRHTLGKLVGLTWPPMWDGAKKHLLDGIRIVAEALPAGGWHQTVEYRFTKVPGTDANGELTGGHAFIVDTDSLDDITRPLA